MSQVQIPGSTKAPYYFATFIVSTIRGERVGKLLSQEAGRFYFQSRYYLRDPLWLRMDVVRCMGNIDNPFSKKSLLVVVISRVNVSMSR